MRSHDAVQRKLKKAPRVGRSGWVPATFAPKDGIDENCRAQAQKKLVANLPDDPCRR